MSTIEFLKRAAKTKAKKEETKEVDIEGEYVKFAKTLGCLAIKLILLNRRGFPDRTTLCPGGRILFIEFKRPGEPLRPTQAIVRKTLESFGFEYHLCDGFGQAEQALTNFLQNN